MAVQMQKSCCFAGPLGGAEIIHRVFSLPDRYPISPPSVNNTPHFLWEITPPILKSLGSHKADLNPLPRVRHMTHAWTFREF